VPAGAAHLRTGRGITLERHKNGWKIIPWGVGLELSLPGAHNAVNAMAALLMARCLGADISSAAEAVNGVTAEEGRGRIVRADNIVILDESYNANPDSTRACLTTLDSFEGPRAAVLGDMLELGDEGPAYHEEILKMADGMELEFLILTGPIYGSVCRSIMKTRTMTAADWKEALELLRREAQCGCTVLVKGSHSIGLDRLVSSLIEGEG